MRLTGFTLRTGFRGLKRSLGGLSLVASLIVVCTNFASASASNTVKPLDIYDIEYAAGTQISTDGDWISYLVNKADIRKDVYQRELWITDYAGEHTRLLSDASQSPSGGAWSPSGLQLAFVANTQGSSQIHIYDRTTGLVEQVSSLEGYPSRLTWSPDGHKLAFTMFVPEDVKPISTAPKAPEGAQWNDDPVEITERLYRMDRAGYRKSGAVQLFVFDLKHKTAKQLSKGSFAHGGVYTLASMPSWMPDSRSIVISLIRDQALADQYHIQRNIYQYDVNSGKVKQLTNDNGAERSSVVSPDGKNIAFIGTVNKEGEYLHVDAYYMPAKGGKPVNLTARYGMIVNAVQWSGDSKSLYIEYEDSGEKVISELSLDGEMSLVYKGLGVAGDSLPYASGSGFSIARNGRFVVSASTPERPSEVMVGRKGEDGLHKLTSVSDKFLSKVRFNSAKAFNVPSTQGDHQVQGWLITPPDYDPKKKYPLIIDMHGGPYAAYSAQFSYAYQLMAARGYLVAYTNPRGSTGYGRDFVDAINYKFPEPDSEDMLDVADYLAKKGYVDNRNMFISGGSGGGLLTAWLTTKTDRFNAAALLYPVINWETMATTADQPTVFTRIFMQKDPWDAMENYRKRSPISYVNRVKTPTIILTGEEDYRTPMSQSEEYFGALKMLGVDAALVRFPNEPHGLDAVPSHSMKSSLYVVDWFDRYRK